MKITGNIYASTSFGRAKMTNEAALRDFNSLLKSNNVILNAQLKPNGKGYTVTKLELAKEDPYGTCSDTVPITDSNGDISNKYGFGYAVSSDGKNINDALLNMIRCYKGQALYCSKNGSSPIFSIPNYII